MTKRLNEIVLHIISCNTFADVGCDHGLVAKFVADNKLAKRVIISDVSVKSLKKAEKLLENYSGEIQSIVADGFCGFEGQADQAVIAGMGGEEIAKILSSAKILPNRLILSPQKNQGLVRKTLILKGYQILRDYTIKDCKFYSVIVAEVGRDNYSEKELFFGRENLLKKPLAFLEELRFQRQIYENALKGEVGLENSNILKEKIKIIDEVLNEN